MPPAISPPAGAGLQFLTRRQLAALLGVTEDTVSAYVRRGELPRPTVLSRSKHVWPLAEVQAALDRLRERGQRPQGGESAA